MLLKGATVHVLPISRESIQLFWLTNGSIRIRHQNNEVTSVTHIEGLERHFLEDDNNVVTAAMMEPNINTYNNIHTYYNIQELMINTIIFNS